MTWHTDDAALEALLSLRDDAALDDAAFTQAVMRRVRAEAVGPRPGLDGSVALALMRQRQHAEGRRRRWLGAASLAGAAVAAAVWWAGGGTQVALAPPQSLALLIGLAATVALVVGQALRELR